MSDIYIFEGSRKLDIIDLSIELFISLFKLKSGKTSFVKINISNKIKIERVKPNNIPPNLSKLLIIVCVSFVLEINSGLVEELEIDTSWIMDFTDFFETTKPFC